MNKRCCKCDQWLTVDNFSKDKNRPDGLYPQCRLCGSKYYQDNKEQKLEYQREYRENHKEEKAKSNAKYRQENKEKVAGYKLKYSLKNKEKDRIRSAEYRKNNKEKRTATCAKWKRSNKDKNCASTMKRKAARLNQTPTDADLKIIQFYYTVCNETNEILGDVFFHVDHVQPLSKGGLHHEDNLQILEVPLNLQKNNRWPLSNEEQLRYKGVTLL